jgi:hypothetical protein
MTESHFGAIDSRRHEEIWDIQEMLDFPQWVYGFDRNTPDLMVQVTQRLSELLGPHAADIPE